QDCLKVLCAGCRGVLRTAASAPATAALRASAARTATTAASAALRLACGRSGASLTLRLRIGRRQRDDCENDPCRDTCPNSLSSKVHGGPPLLTNRWGRRRKPRSPARPAWSPT